MTQWHCYWKIVYTEIKEQESMRKGPNALHLLMNHTENYLTNLVGSPTAGLRKICTSNSYWVHKCGQ